jgi:hypothetical protein
MLILNNHQTHVGRKHQEKHDASTSQDGLAQLWSIKENNQSNDLTSKVPLESVVSHKCKHA